MKEICVIGLGRFGHQLALELARNKVEVIAVDSDSEKVNAIAPYVGRAITADVRKFDVLQSLIPSSIDAVVVAIGGLIEVSVLCTLHLKNMGVSKIVSRANNKDHYAILKAVGADEVIIPEQDLAERLAAMLINPNIIDYLPMVEDFHIVEIAPLSEMIGHSFRELDLRQRYGVYVIAVREYLIPEKLIMMPDPDYVIKDVDSLIVMGPEDKINSLTQLQPET